MAFSNRISTGFHFSARSMLLAIIASAVMSATFAISSVTASRPRVTSEDFINQSQPGTRSKSHMLATEPDWLAIDNEQTGIVIELGAQWHETEQSLEHEREVIISPNWTFSRIFDCRGRGCDSAVRVILSGGVFRAKIDITSFSDLADQMPRREVAQLGAMIVGAINIDPDSLTPISRAGAFGYRLHANLLDVTGAPIALVVDCLYRADRFLVLTAIADKDRQIVAEQSLDDIARGITITQPDAKRAAQSGE